MTDSHKRASTDILEVFFYSSVLYVCLNKRQSSSVCLPNFSEHNFSKFLPCTLFSLTITLSLQIDKRLVVTSFMMVTTSAISWCSSSGARFARACENAICHWDTLHEMLFSASLWLFPSGSHKDRSSRMALWENNKLFAVKNNLAGAVGAMCSEVWRCSFFHSYPE